MNPPTAEAPADRYGVIPVETAGAVAPDGGPAPALGAIRVAVTPGSHACPACRRRVTHQDTLCGFCWTKRGPCRQQPGVLGDDR